MVKTEMVKQGLIDPVDYAVWQWPFLKHHEYGLLLDDFQVDLLRSVFSGDIVEVFCKGGTGVGKGAVVAMAVNVFFRVHSDAKVVVTSSSNDHAVRVMFSEIVKWRMSMTDPGPGEAQSESIVDKENGERQHYIEVVNPDADESFRGHHSSHVMFVFDEASGVQESRYNLAGTQAHKVVAIANPTVLMGWFHDKFYQNPASDPDLCHTVGRSRMITADGYESRNVKEGKEIIPGQITREIIRDNIEPKGDGWVRVMGHGKFPLEDAEQQVIPPSWLRRCVAEWRDGLKVQAFGLDVAASDQGDMTVLAAGGVDGVAKLHRWREKDQTRIVGLVLDTALREHGIELTKGNHSVVVDADGLGIGVYFMLKEKGVSVVEHHGAETADDTTNYQNRRAESYGELGRRLDPNGKWSDKPWPMPNDMILLQDLSAPKRIYGSQWPKFRITPKEPTKDSGGTSLREILKRSPDSGDAVTYLYRRVREIERSGDARFGYVPQVVDGKPMTDSMENRIKERMEKLMRVV